MRARLLLAFAALLAVPACLDPIVGTQCAKGYSPCGGKCVAAGTCGIDAGKQADSEQVTMPDGGLGEPAAAADAEAAETGLALDGSASADGIQSEVGVSHEDAPLPADCKPDLTQIPNLWMANSFSSGDR